MTENNWFDTSNKIDIQKTNRILTLVVWLPGIGLPVRLYEGWVRRYSM